MPSVITAGAVCSGSGLYYWSASGNTTLPVILPGQASHGMTRQMHLEHAGVAACVVLCKRSDTLKNGA